MNLELRPLNLYQRSGLILVYGALSLAAQVIILREFLTLAQGNEVFLGLGLWTWLIWTGLGSLLGGRLAVNFPVSRNLLAQLLACLAVGLPVTVILTRALPTLLGWTSGVAPSPLSLGIWYAILSGPFCFISGFFFPLACLWLRGQQDPAGIVGRTYGLDALGMSLGGILLQVLLIGRWDSLWLALFLGLAVLLSLVWVPRIRPRRMWLLFLGLTVLSAGALAALAWLPDASRRWQWPRRTVLAVQETPHSVWVVTQEAEQTSFAAHGLWFFSYPDPQTAEEQVHLALLQHPRPERVLLLGSGVAGLAAEILKTPCLTQLDYVELDPQLIDLTRRVLPPKAQRPFQNARLQVIPDDARRFIQQPGPCYDVIIMALPEPKNALLNRFYTQEFFAAVKNRLNPGGVFSFGLTGSETSLTPRRSRYLALGAATLESVFPEVVVLPGLTWRFFASGQPGALTPDPDILLARQRDRDLELLYVREYYLKANLSPERREYARVMLQQAPVEINSDLQPRGLFYGLLLAGMTENSLLPPALVWLQHQGVTVLYAAIALISLGLWGWSQQRAAGRRTGPYLYSVFTMGLAVMGLEVVVLILFQTTLGYLYGQLSLLLAAFMAGMAGGSYLAGACLARGWWAPDLALAGQGGLVLLMGGLGLSLPWILQVPLFRQAGWGQACFALILIGAGLLGGVVFAAQGELCRQQGAPLSLSAGRLYAVDLLGATVGTLGMSFFILPCFGPAQALFLGAAWNLAAMALLVGERWYSRSVFISH